MRSFLFVAFVYGRFLSVQEKIGKIGAAWRIAEEREKERKKAIKRAERLGLTIHGDFDVAAGTAGINSEKSGADQNKTPNMASPKDNKKKSAKLETLDSDAYGKELAAMAMGADFSAVQGPGKVMSMGTSSYLADMVSRRSPNVMGDMCTVALILLRTFVSTVSFSLHVSSSRASCWRRFLVMSGDFLFCFLFCDRLVFVVGKRDSLCGFDSLTCEQFIF